MRKTQIAIALTLALGLAWTTRAEERPTPSQQGSSATQDNSFTRSAAEIQHRLEESLNELTQLRQRIADEKIPLDRRLNALEKELSQVRVAYQQTSRILDSRTLDLSNLRSEIKARHEEATYLLNLLGEYTRNFESRLHIAELQRYSDALEKAKLATDNAGLSPQQVYDAQAALVAKSLRRLENALGGTRFQGTAVDANGLVKPGTFLLVGPTALFRSDDGQEIGTAEQRLGSLESAVIPFASPEDQQAADHLFSSSAGFFPLDPTLGNAHKVESTQETLVEHIKKGGPVMVPIFVLAGAALLVVVFKWVHLLFVRSPSRKQIAALLHAVANRDEQAARQAVKAIRGPTGKMLTTGIEHLHEPRELIEEVMYEIVLATRLRLQRMLPFISISASAAPLLGLLGTVTGIINTFKLITVFGSGDVKTLSGGISEALITTEFGLIVAIPSLLLHAFLSRKARGVVDQMEKAAVSFINQVSKTPLPEETDVTPRRTDLAPQHSTSTTHAPEGSAHGARSPIVAAPRASHSDVSPLDHYDFEAVPTTSDGRDVGQENARLKRQLVEKELENDILKTKVALKESMVGSNVSRPTGEKP